MNKFLSWPWVKRFSHLWGLADHKVSHCLESCNHGAQLDLLIGSRGEPVSEETTRDEHLDAFMIFYFQLLVCNVSISFLLMLVYERKREWSHLLNVGQLDEQTDPNSWRKVHLKGGRGEENNQISVLWQRSTDTDPKIKQAQGKLS